MSPLCFSKGSDITLSSCQQAGFTPKIAAVRKDVEDIKGLVSSSIQIALLPVDCLYDHIPRSIQKIRFSYPQVTRTVGIIRQKERELTSSENNFFKFAKDLYRQMEGFL